MEFVRPLDANSLRDSEELAGPSTGVPAALFRAVRRTVKAGPIQEDVHADQSFYWIISGRLRVVVDSKEFTARPNSLVILPPGVSHEDVNPGPEDCLYLEILIPPSGQPVEGNLTSIKHQESDDWDYVRPIDIASLDPGRRSVREFAGPSTGVNACVFRYQRIPAGEKADYGQHVHPVYQFYWIISGTMAATLFSEEHRAGPNSLVILPPGVPHGAMNLELDGCVHLEILVPAPEPGRLGFRVSSSF